MRYTYFEIHNFKGIQHVRLDLDAKPSSRIVALIGLNESGKTTILEAINSFTYGEQAVVDDVIGAAERDPHRVIPVARRSNFSDEVVLEVGIEVDEDDVVALREHVAPFLKGASIDISGRHFRIRERTLFRNSRFDKKITNWYLTLDVKAEGQRKFRSYANKADFPVWNMAALFLMKRLPHIRFFPNFLFEFPDRIYLQPDKDSPKEQFYTLLLDSIVASLDVGANVEEHILQRATSNAREDKQSLEGLLLQLGRSLTKQVFGAWNDIFKRHIGDKSVVVTLGSDDTDRPYLRLQIQDADGYFALSERSLGFRWFFVYLLLTSYGGKGGSDVLYLLDEPASNLHSTAQAQLLQSFEKVAEDNWLVYTTHSHHLVNPAWLESTFVVKNAGVDVVGGDEYDYTAAQTDIELTRYRQFVASHPDQTRYFQPVLDVLDYEPSRLEMVPDVVMVEGKNDFYSLQYFQQALKLDRVALMPGGGAGSLDTVIRLYVGWGRNFVVLMDSDAEGIKQARRYMDLFGSVMDGRLYTLADVDSGWSGRTLEHLIEPNDRVAVQRAVDPLSGSYEKKAFNRAVQELTLLRKSVSVSGATETRMRSLHNFLKERLEQLSMTVVS